MGFHALRSIGWKSKSVLFACDKWTNTDLAANWDCGLLQLCACDFSVYCMVLNCRILEKPARHKLEETDSWLHRLCPHQHDMVGLQFYENCDSNVPDNLHWAPFRRAIDRDWLKIRQHLLPTTRGCMHAHEFPPICSHTSHIRCRLQAFLGRRR